MQNLFNILSKYHVTLLFVVLEVIALIFIFQGKNHQRNAFISSANSLTGNTYSTIQNFKDYSSLKEVNLDLAKENAYLRSLIPSSLHSIENNYLIQNDSIYQQKFIYKVAKVIQNSTLKKNNFITLNVGLNDGIKPEMGVITNQGVVGFVANVSENYSTVISFLNTKTTISAKIKSNNATGTLSWEGKDITKAILNDVPLSTQIEIGDTIITSGFSAFYPSGIMLGIIESSLISTNQQMREIHVNLFEKYNALSYVYVVENIDKLELEKLEAEKQKFND